MLYIELTNEQRNDLISLIDVYLKLNGISGLSKSVELMNVLNSARVKPTEFEVTQNDSTNNEVSRITSH